MKELLTNRKLVTYILSVLVIFQVALLLIQFFVLGNRSGLPKSGADEDFPFPLFLFFFVFIPFIVFFKKNKLSENRRILLGWGLVILAAIVLYLMVIVLIKAW